MKKIILLVALFVSPVFAQEEEIQIELESGGSSSVDSILNGSNGRAVQIAAMPDGSVWHFGMGLGLNRVVHCHVNEDGIPRCQEVDIEDPNANGEPPVNYR